MLSFQDIIFKLQNYWSEKGCPIVQPFDMEVGAGTFHPMTFLKAIGSESWSAAYVQPSRRPSDGRYGKNPNRSEHYYQFQVIMKPSPRNFQNLYLNSLHALGVNTLENDVRFVEDNWESPTLGAWGLGWEVWLNGMEITQFTYFQQMGGLECKPTMVELTYGLERLAMHSQNVDSMYDLLWADTLTRGPLYYRDIHQQSEYERSQYNFKEASIEHLSNHFNFLEKDTNRLLKKGLVFPSYEMVLKASHLFNLLDSRRAISVLERQHYILRIRALSCKIAELQYKKLQTF